MKNKASEIYKKMIQTKAFYAVAASLILVIIGVAAAIFNVAKVRTDLTNTKAFSDATSGYSVTQGKTDSQANLNQTGIPDNREQSSSASDEENSLNKPYSGYFLLPINGKVTKDYSDEKMVYSKTMNDWRTHDGTDFSGKTGDKIIAIQDGRVSAVYNDALWGDVIEITHGGKMSAKYCGVKTTLKENDSVEQGQVIGTLTEIPTESKDGAHLHLEITVDGTSADPIEAMNVMKEETSAE
ncbi:MAG: M23 family metallopeptidase [Clostridia bacterium]|nr:M23 family metallopeptidase [Clostridia bacterium]